MRAVLEMNSYTSAERGFEIVMVGVATLSASADACMSLSLMNTSISLRIAAAAYENYWGYRDTIATIASNVFRWMVLCAL